jgi:hypothetical protein
MTMSSITMVYLETEHFTFQAVDETPELAMQALVRVLKKHATWRSIPRNWYEDYLDGVQSVTLELGHGARDWDPT